MGRMPEIAACPHPLLAKGRKAAPAPTPANPTCAERKGHPRRSPAPWGADRVNSDRRELCAEKREMHRWQGPGKLTWLWVKTNGIPFRGGCINHVRTYFGGDCVRFMVPWAHWHVSELRLMFATSDEKIEEYGAGKLTWGLHPIGHLGVCHLHHFGVSWSKLEVF